MELPFFTVAHRVPVVQLRPILSAIGFGKGRLVLFPYVIVDKQPQKPEIRSELPFYSSFKAFDQSVLLLRRSIFKFETSAERRPNE